MIYLAIDPGGTTGFAWLVEDANLSFGCGQIEGRHEAEQFVRDMYAQHRDEGVTVIIERWDVRKNTHTLTNQDDPRYIIGWVDGYCHEHGIPYKEQTPAQAKRFADDLKLQRIGWYVKGQDHSRDAARHLMTYLAKQPGPAGDHVREGLLA
jgi:hypothetical protein